jgi:putative heme-binding domain-containing protein
VALDPNAPESQRVPAIGLLAHTSYADCGPSLLSLLDLKQPQPVQLAALSALSHFNEPQLATLVIQHWDAFSPRLRSEAAAVLLARPERATTLLKAIEAGTIRANALDSTQVKFLRNHKDKAVHQLAAKVLAARPASTRQQVIDSFSSALTLKGESAPGKKIYEERCSSCHRLAGEGFALGPDLITVKTAGKEKIMTNILDPNAEVRPEYISYLIETKDDNSLVGVVVNETASAVTLRQAFGKEDVIPRDKIASMKSQGASIMPEGLESGLTPQDMANLLEFITTANQ